MIVSDWMQFVRQILNYAGHGYVYYSYTKIPVEKENKIKQIEKKIISKYPMCEWDKDKRYRAKKNGKANYAYIRWGLHFVMLRTEGQECIPEDPERFKSFSDEPLVFDVGEWIKIKISKAKTGKKYTAYLAKSSYRSIKALLQENIEHKQKDVFFKNYNKLQELPAFSGILEQMEKLRLFCRNKWKKYKSKKEKRIVIDKLVLKKVY